MNSFRVKLILLSLAVSSASLTTCAFAQDDAAVAQMIANLDGGFQARVKALKDLEAAGDAAIEPLRKALPNAGLQARQDIERLLKILEPKSMLVRVSKLEQAPTLANAEGLPEWDRYRKFVGDDEASLRFYARLLKAEPELFGAAAKKGRGAARAFSSTLLQKASDLVRETEPRRKFNIDAYAALLLVSSNNDHGLRGKTSYNISAMLLDSTFRLALKSDDGPFLKALAGQYILRSYINPEKPLLFAQLHPMPQGLQLARQTLQTKFRGHNGIHAIRVIREQGKKSDIALLESLFSNADLFFSSQSGPAFTVTNGDVALASAIVMRGRDPRDFGYAPQDDRQQGFRFIVGTTGFPSQEARDATREKYFSAFPEAKQ